MGAPEQRGLRSDQLLSLNELKTGMLGLPVMEALKLTEAEVAALFQRASKLPSRASRTSLTVGLGGAGFSPAKHLSQGQFVHYFGSPDDRPGSHAPPLPAPGAGRQPPRPDGDRPRLSAVAAYLTVTPSAQLLSADPLQRFRDLLYRQKTTPAEACDRLDVDRDVFVDRADFETLYAGTGPGARRLGDIRDLGLAEPAHAGMLFDLALHWLRAAWQTPHRSGWQAKGGEAVVDYIENEKLALALAEPPAPNGPTPSPPRRSLARPPLAFMGGRFKQPRALSAGWQEQLAQKVQAHCLETTPRLGASRARMVYDRWSAATRLACASMTSCAARAEPRASRCPCSSSHATTG
jgi:hypothetical protein